MECPLLEVKNLSVRIQANDKQSAFVPVNDISFTIQPGEVLALVGESGSGKSLTALAIMELLPPAAYMTEASYIYFKGQDISILSEHDLHRIRGKRIAMIFQEPMTAFNPVMTIGAQINEVLQWHFNLTKIERYARTIELLKRVGINDPHLRYHQYPHQLSGGIKQRAMIAMSLAGEPELLIADEPTTALDVSIQSQIMALLYDLTRSSKMSLLLITHDLAIVRQLADRVAVMQTGQLLEMAQVDNFFASPQHPYSQALLNAVLSINADYSQFVISPAAFASSPSLLTVSELSIQFKLNNASRWFAKKQLLHAVNQVSFNLKESEILAVVGESGCGKTTLARGILRLTPINKGEINFNHHHVTQLSPRQLRQLRRHMQIVLQDPYSSLNPRMQVKDIIGEGLTTFMPQLSSKEREAYIAELLEQVELSSDMMHRYPHEFSGGQRQRICIARVLALQPAFLICDEPTSALDVTVSRQVLDLLLRLRTQRQMSYLFITHNLAVVNYMADRVMVMYLGYVVEMGAKEQVLKTPKHPYTQALIAAVPDVETRSLKEFSPFETDLPSPTAILQGCPYHPRCPHVMPQCLHALPELKTLKSQHEVRCYLYE